MSSYEPYVPRKPVPEAPGEIDREMEAAASRPAARGWWCGRQGGEAERFVVASGTCVAIWLMAGAGYFWPMWVMLGTGVPVLVRLGRRGLPSGPGEARSAYPGDVEAAASVSGRLRRRDRQY